MCGGIEKIKMILVLRIHGQVGLKHTINETLYRLKIRRKLACTLIDKEDKIMVGMLNSVRDYVAFGEISDELAKKLIEKRGETLEGKPIKDAGKVLEDIKKGEWKIKRFFRLHPPVGGFKRSTKLHSPKGILGENKEISKLVERML